MKPKEWKELLEKIVIDKTLEPKEGTTFCNIAVQIEAEAFGYDGFIIKEDGKLRGLMANEIMAIFESESRNHLVWVSWSRTSIGPGPPPGDWCEVDMKSAATAASLGIPTYGACYGSKKIGTPREHGHVAAVFPGGMVYSGKWGKECPLVANIGERNGIFGANYCFKEEPRWFVFVKASEEFIKTVNLGQAA